jgi:thiamine pyrophosphokinase
MIKRCIIIANGKPPRKSVVNFFRKRGFNYLICADGGANSLSKLDLVPQAIIGDMDSISTGTLNRFRKKTIIIKIKRQNDTDVEKALKYAIKNKFNEALLLGAAGDRLDHTICNLGIVLKFYQKILISIISEKSYLKPYNEKVELKSYPGEIISLYGFDSKTKISSRGLNYPLKNTSLPFGEKESTSNVSISEKVNLTINGGTIFVIRDFNFMKKYDLF